MDPVYLQNYDDFKRPNKGKDPASYNTIREVDSICKEVYNLTAGFLFELYATVVWRTDSIKANFTHDFFHTKAIWYPFIVCYLVETVENSLNRLRKIKVQHILLWTYTNNNFKIGHISLYG